MSIRVTYSPSENPKYECRYNIYHVPVSGQLTIGGVYTCYFYPVARLQGDTTGWSEYNGARVGSYHVDGMPYEKNLQELVSTYNSSTEYYHERILISSVVLWRKGNRL